jgi:hypothetical protein
MEKEVKAVRDLENTQRGIGEPRLAIRVIGLCRDMKSNSEQDDLEHNSDGNEIG